MKESIGQVEQIFKALANRRRLTILRLLSAQGSTSVGDIAAELKLSYAATSRHLRALLNTNLVEQEQVNTTVNYSLPTHRPLALQAAIKMIR